jgi:predicted ATP-grasp superfamily ATP-dependent carboligase
VNGLERHLAERPMPPAIVAEVGWVNGLGAIRQLAHAGIPVIAIDHRRSALGFKSRHAFAVLVPDPVADPDGYVDALTELGDAIGRPAPIFPTHDDHLNAIAAGAERLGGRFLYPFPTWDVLEPIQSKRNQLARAAELGIPAPRTTTEPSDDLVFPVLVKPSDPVGFRRTFKLQSFRCETRAELDKAWERAQPYEPLIQEWIPGGDDELYTLGCYLARDGEALGLFCGRKLLQTPPGVGSGRVCESVWVEEVVDQGLAYLRGLECHGLSQTEFKRDPRDGAYKLMEVNPRLWQWHGLGAALGVDFPLIAYWDLLGARLPAARMNGGRRKRWAITFMRGERPAFVRPPYIDPLVALDDPMPALAHARRLVRGRGR